MFLYDPDGLRLGELKTASVIDGDLYLKLRGLKPRRITYDGPAYAALELQSIAQAMAEGKAMYTLDNDHRVDLEPEDANYRPEEIGGAE